MTLSGKNLKQVYFIVTAKHSFSLVISVNKISRFSQKLFMIYNVLSQVFGATGSRTIETEKDLITLIEESKTGLIPLKDGSFIGIDLLRSSFIKPQFVVSDTDNIKKRRTLLSNT